MGTRAMRRLTLVAGLAWLVVAGYGVREVAVGDGDDWEVAYAVLVLALLVGTAASVSAGALATHDSVRPRLRIAGLVVSCLGCAVAIVGAWALPVWMTLLGVGFALVAAASGPSRRRALALMAAGQLIGVVVLIAGIEASVGRRDEYGDYPAAGGIAVAFVAAMAIVAVVRLRRGTDPAGDLPGDPSLILGVGATE